MFKFAHPGRTTVNMYEGYSVLGQQIIDLTSYF